eukprot:2254228-Pyramimonas_sp.AAC.1
MAPRLRHAAVAFKARDDRVATLRIKVHGGVLTLANVCAPHSGCDYADRKQFYDELGNHIRPATTHSAIVVTGDFNAKLLYVGAGEGGIIGPHVPRRSLGGTCESGAKGNQLSNRHIMVECCVQRDLAVANTCFDNPDDMKVTCRSIGANPKGR